MQTHELTPRTPRTKTKRLGRGDRRGKTSGRGHKGQKARAGGTPRPQLRDTLKKLPKRRGYGVNRSQSVNSRDVKPAALNVGVLEHAFEAGEAVTPQTLVAKQLVKRHNGRAPAVKILGGGEISTKLTIQGCEVSKTAREKIEKAGGSVQASAA